MNSVDVSTLGVLNPETREAVVKDARKAVMNFSLHFICQLVMRVKGASTRRQLTRRRCRAQLVGRSHIDAYRVW